MIEIISARENEGSQTVFFKITEGKDVYEWHGDCPKEADPQAYFEAMKDKLHFLVLQKMYRDGETWADWQRFQKEGMTELEAMLAWIAAGCQNQVLIGVDEKEKPVYELKAIEKQPWRSTHPPGLAMAKDIDALDVKEDLKDVLKKVIIT